MGKVSAPGYLVLDLVEHLLSQAPDLLVHTVKLSSGSIVTLGQECNVDAQAASSISGINCSHGCLALCFRLG